MTLKRTDFAADNRMPQNEIVSGQNAFSQDWRQKHLGPGSGGWKVSIEYCARTTPKCKATSSPMWDQPQKPWSRQTRSRT